MVLQQYVCTRNDVSAMITCAIPEHLRTNVCFEPAVVCLCACRGGGGEGGEG